jgi:methyl-accepting chemotaxis protein
MLKLGKLRRSDPRTILERVPAAELADLRGQVQAIGRSQAVIEEISSGNASLSARVEAQAASLEETTASMMRMTETVRENAENASQANQLALVACDHAERGGKIMHDAVGAMQVSCRPDG